MLRHITSTISVATANSLSRALKNLNSQTGRTTTREGAKVLFMKSDIFSPAAIKKIKNYTKGRELATDVIVVGHNDKGFVDYVKRHADRGEFNNKSVVLLTCGRQNIYGLADALLESGANEVLYFTEPIKTLTAHFFR